MTQRVKVGGQTVFFTIGLYMDGRPGEVFIDVAKAGTALRAWAGSTAKLMSLMLQYGVPVHELVGALAGHCSETYGTVDVRGHKQITESCGILDTIVRSMALDFLARELHEAQEDEDDSSMSGS